MPAFWPAPIETVLTGLEARPEGLTQIEANRRLLRIGPNRSSTSRRITPLGLLLNQFRSPLVLLLLFAMTLSLFLGETMDGLIVLAIVLGSALLGFFQEYRASSAVAKLLAVIQTRVTVLRDGHEQATVHAEQNAIADAARRGVSVAGSTAYISHFPCINCAKILAAAGVQAIKYHFDYSNDPLVLDVLGDAGVTIAKY